MIRGFVIFFVANTGLISQVYPLVHQVKQIPFFRYPALAKVAKIQGRVDMVICVEKGQVTSVRPPDGQKEFRIRQLSEPAVEAAKHFEFFPGFTGEVTIHLEFRISEKEGSKSRVEFDPESNTFLIEADTPHFCALPATTK